MTKVKSMTERELLTAALIGLDVQKLTVEASILHVQRLLDGKPPRKPVEFASPAPKKRKKRRLSAAGRKAIAEAMRRRWAKVRAAKPGTLGTKGRK